MVEIRFTKMHGAGNDFIVLTGDEYRKLKNKEQNLYLCHRRLGIGSDGIIVIQAHDPYDFGMRFINPDGSSGMFCGNGSRCAVARAYELGWIPKECQFLAIDGPHSAVYHAYDDIEVSMKNVDQLSSKLDGYFLDTGAPHYVEIVDHLDELDVEKMGARIRYHELFQPKGTNANFIEDREGAISIRTYERGVEKETLACGTGITAAALAYADHNNLPDKLDLRIHARGGELRIQAMKNGPGFEHIKMRGPSTKVFEGKISIPDHPFSEFDNIPRIKD